MNRPFKPIPIVGGAIPLAPSASPIEGPHPAQGFERGTCPTAPNTGWERSAGTAGETAPHSGFVRVRGEAFDADQLEWRCEDCGLTEWGCECEPETPSWPVTEFPGGAKLTIEEVQDRIARVFMGVKL